MIENRCLWGNAIGLADDEVATARVNAGVERVQLGESNAAFARELAASVALHYGVVRLTSLGGAARQIAGNTGFVGARRRARRGRRRGTSFDAVRCTNLRGSIRYQVIHIASN